MTCMPRHRHRELLRFLRSIDQQTPAGPDPQVIVDNHTTHKTPAAKHWLKPIPASTWQFMPNGISRNQSDQGRRTDSDSNANWKNPVRHIASTASSRYLMR